MAISRVPPSATLVLLLGSFPAIARAQTAAPRKTCTIADHAPYQGERDLSRGDYKAALALYQPAAEQQPGADEAQLGYVRALIGLNRPEDALKQARIAVAASPDSAAAQVALGEAEFRTADFDAAQATASKALQLDPCEGRAYAFAARILTARAFWASAAHDLELARKLRPLDPSIRGDWIDSLPASRQAAELTTYLSDPQVELTEKARDNLKQTLAHLQARASDHCQITLPSEHTAIPFVIAPPDRPHPDYFLVDVKINRRPVHLVVDTGASGITLSRRDAEGMGLKPEQEIRLGGVGENGLKKGYLAHAADIQIAGVHLSNCLVSVYDEQFGGDDFGGVSLIGMDVFRDWLVTLNFPSNQIELSPLPAANGSHVSLTVHPSDDLPAVNALYDPAMKDWLRIVRIGHSILVPTKVGNSTTHWMIMDTGASLSNMSLPYARAVGKVDPEVFYRMGGISGEVTQLYKISDVTLRFGNLLIGPNRFEAYDMSSISRSTGAEVSGLLGIHTLCRLKISIDYRDDLLQFVYDPKKDGIYKFATMER